MTVVYLAGPMRGLPRFNEAAFVAVAAALRGLGLEVLSPIEMDGDWSETMTGDQIERGDATGFDMGSAALRCTKAIAAADVVLCLPGWRASRGATAEVAVARWLGRRVAELPEGAPLYAWAEVPDDPPPVVAGPVVGLAGLAGSGKDTAAALLVERHGATRIAWADPVREAALALDPLVFVPWSVPPVRRLSSLLESVGWEEAKRCHDVRRLLQRLGKEMGRGVLGPALGLGSGLWVEIGLRRAREASGLVVFSDCRFPDELAAVRSLGGHTVWIERGDGLDGDAGAHASESSVGPGDCDFVVTNRGTPADMLAGIEAVVRLGR